MSSNLAAGGGGRSSVSDFVPETQCPTRVFINGTRVPAADTDVHIRKEGPLSVTRYAEATFASPWAGNDYLSILNTFGANQDSPDILRIDGYNGQQDTHFPLFYGVVTGVGSSPDHDNEKLFQARAQGPGQWLENIPASRTFTGDSDAIDAVEYIAETADSKIPFSITTAGSADATETAGEPLGVPDADETDDLRFLTARKLLHTNKVFTANKHTLGDVVSWLQGKISGRLWIEPTEEGGQLIVSDNPSAQSTSHTAHYLDGDTKVINNNALAELRPINTIVVNGRAKRTFTEVGDFEINRGADTFFKAKARHKPLYEAAGETELSETVKKSDAESEQEVINEAKSKLKARVDGSTAGGIQVVHDAHITPFDTITARPTINEQPDSDVPAITYEVTRAHYKTRPNEDGVLPHIDLNVGVHTDMEDDIEILRTWREEA